MSNSLQVVNQNQDLTSQFTSRELELITHTIAKGATPEELQLFLYRCKLMQLNPLKPGQIHFIKYGQGPGTIVVGIEGFRSTAARTGKHVSTNRGVKLDENRNIIEGWARVRRRDQSNEIQDYFEETPFEEYFNEKNPSWRRMPKTMIKKCAEAATLRMAYPDDLGGIYIPEEVELISDLAPTKMPWIEQPNADDGSPEMQALRPYMIKFGSMSKRTLPEALRTFGPEKIKHAIELCEAKLEKRETYANVTAEDMREFVTLAAQTIAAYERGEFFEETEKGKFGLKVEEEFPF